METARYVRLHGNFGWWSLLLFVSLGIVLESLHGFKVAWYLNVGEETRRLLWRLAHAHGTFLGLIHIAFTVAVKDRSLRPVARKVASRCLIGASVALPGGFFLGGTTIYRGDPGLGIVLLPFGAAMLWVAILLTALGRTPPLPAAAEATAPQKLGRKQRKH
jgi:hypothetical protein